MLLLMIWLSAAPPAVLVVSHNEIKGTLFFDATLYMISFDRLSFFRNTDDSTLDIPKKAIRIFCLCRRVISAVIRSS